ncbi:MAG: hypothetical protein A2086_11745 [Spirochaetes bacterium GWD1_27_9]|nr:MAG: hypothetical protein A2Y34_16675 [Spirochaetes bacterium GWC1_27_15]OHD28634.1 MAG: hypothetical protein A2086_11745 [Spirochaetes bacterium GWD1_27_9]
MRYFDTNCLVYLNDVESIYHKSVLELFKKTIDNNQLALNEIILVEFFQVMTNPKKVIKPWSTEFTIKYMKQLIEIANQVDFIDKELFFYALDIQKMQGITKYEIYDYLIVELMRTNGIDEIVTVNYMDFKKYNDINVIVPKS